MNDRLDELVQRAAVLKAESAALQMVSEELAGRLPGGRQAADRAMEQPREPGPVAGGDSAGKAPVLRSGAGLLDEDEAVALAGLLEELAARYRPDPLSGPVLRAAALLRRRVAAWQQQDTGRRRDGSAVRREAGDTRDDAAGQRDDQAAKRDRLATDRDDRAKERDRQADAADEKARAGERELHDRLWDAELSDQAAGRATESVLSGGGAEEQPSPLDREGAGGRRARDGEDRQAMRELLAQVRSVREAA